MKRFLIGLLLVSFMVSAEPQKEELGRYKIEVTTYVSKKGSVFVLETVFDTKTGKVIERKRFYHTNYGKKKK
jgi:phage-related protein